MTPTVGRIVHYRRARGVAVQPAIIVIVHDEKTVSLQVFDDEADGCVFHHRVEHSDDDLGGVWCWPPRG